MFADRAFRRPGPQRSAWSPTVSAAGEGRADAAARNVTRAIEPSSSAPIRPGGEPLSRGARSALEGDLGHVRVHADAEAADAARAIGARAFTFGPNIAFAAGEYRPETVEGSRLLAHEATHAADQAAAATPAVQRKAFVGAQPLTVDEAYKKIVRTTWGQKAVARLEELASDKIEHRFANWGELTAEYKRAQAAPDPKPLPQVADDQDQLCASLPSFKQLGPSCATASLVTPLLVWDQESFTPGQPNARLRSLVGKVKADLIAQKKTVQPFLDQQRPGSYREYLSVLDQLADAAKDDSYKPGESEFKALGALLLVLSTATPAKGLGEAEMQGARAKVGFGAKSTTPVGSFDGFFDASSGLRALEPGQMAQIVWVMKPAAGSTELGAHAFTIGRLANGTWILNDQGAAKPMCLTGPDLATIKDKLLEASDRGDWTGVTGGGVQLPPKGVITGYAILGDATSPAK